MSEKEIKQLVQEIHAESNNQMISDFKKTVWQVVATVVGGMLLSSLLMVMNIRDQVKTNTIEIKSNKERITTNTNDISKLEEWFHKIK